MPKIAIIGACLMGMVSVAYGQAGQTIYMPPKPEKRWTESQPLYAPYTGPGYGNPDTAAQREPVGHASKKYHDAAGASAYSKGGNTEATTLEKPHKKRKPQTANTQPKPASPAVSEQK
jgi:hypothetical protein